MSLVRWNPFREMEAFQREINRLFEDWPRRWGMGMREGEMSTYEWYPTVDIYEDGAALTVVVELPGVDEKDVKLNLTGNTLHISGEKKFSSERKRENYHRIESYYGTFARSFTLPPNVDHDNISAKMEKGILYVTLPKKEEARPKQIQIKTGK